MFRMIPGLDAAEFLRYGSIHRNSYINSAGLAGPALQARDGAPLFFAGQLTGVEGYTESLGTGLLAGINLARVLDGEAPVTCRRRPRCWAACSATCGMPTRSISSR